MIESKRGVCGYFTMENVPGGSLEKFWHSHGADLVPIETTLDLMKQVCRGIAPAHAGARMDDAAGKPKRRAECQHAFSICRGAKVVIFRTVAILRAMTETTRHFALSR